MPIQEVEGLILLNPSLDRQALYNAGKVAEKLCEEKKHCLAAVLDIAGGDSATIYKHIMKSKETGELSQTMSKLAFDIGQANLIDQDNYSQIFVSGYTSARKIKEMKHQLEEAAKALEKPVMKLKSAKPRRRYHLKVRVPGMGVLQVEVGKS